MHKPCVAHEGHNGVVSTQGGTVVVVLDDVTVVLVSVVVVDVVVRAVYIMLSSRAGNVTSQLENMWQ